MISYADCAYETPLFSGVLSSKFSEGVEITLTVKDEKSLLVGNERKVFLPFESEVELPAEKLLNPVTLAALTEQTRDTVTVTIAKDGETISRSFELVALPYDTYAGNVEQLAGFVRPGLGRVDRTLSEASAQLKKWGGNYEFGGYERDKNKVVKEFASIYSAIKKERYPMREEELPTKVALTGPFTLLDMALFVASCLERAGLYPLILIGERVAVGVWLYEGCFASATVDDMTLIENYVADGIYQLSFVDAEDFFKEEDSFTLACKHFEERLKGGAYELCLDVRRSRLEGKHPLPVKRVTADGYELLTEKELSSETAPKEIFDFNYSFVKQPSGEKQWESRLLDLSFKNPLLQFNSKKYAVPIACADADELYTALAEKGSMKLFPSDDTMRAMNEKKAAPLLSMELSGGMLRALMKEEELEEILPRIIRKGKEADEESGGNLIYLAIGFLSYQVEKQMKAPLLLFPVRVRKGKGQTYHTVECDRGEIEVNTTLLEYLKREHSIDVRGLDRNVEGLRLREIFSMVRAEIAGKKGWTVDEDVYLSVFSFTRFFLWNDVRKNKKLFSGHPIVGALLENKQLSEEDIPIKRREDYPAHSVLTPLIADESQFEAVALSKTGASFVLHGPPGTGKSQTITNIIANALADGKRVLFVAEKEAAISVVAKRLKQIGVGEFCLQLHSSGVKKSDVFEQLDKTLSLNAERDEGFVSEGNRLSSMEQDVARVMESVHQKRRIGVSVYEGICRYLEYKDAPDLVGIRTSFYDSLTQEKIGEYEDLLLSCAYAAKECGEVSGVPFENVNVVEFNGEVRDALYCASKSLIAEINHLKQYLSLFTAQYRQTVSVLTREKLDAIYRIVTMLQTENFQDFFLCEETEFAKFYRANRRLDTLLSEYDSKFKKRVDVEDLLERLKEELGEWEDDSIFHKPVRAVLKRLERVSQTKLTYTQYRSVIETVVELEETTKLIRSCPLSAAFTKKDGSFDENARRTYFERFHLLHALCASAFLDYNVDTFNSMCARTVGGSTSVILKGLSYAIKSFKESLDNFTSAANMDLSKVPSDDMLRYYSDKANAILTHLDKLSSWCNYKKTALSLRKAGLSFLVDALEEGKVDPSNVVPTFEKHIYRNFLETFLTGDTALSTYSEQSVEDKIVRIKQSADAYRERSKAYVRNKLVSSMNEALGGSMMMDVSVFHRMEKGRRGSLNALFANCPLLMQYAAPCLLMSPTTVAQFLPPRTDFDLVIFDEASQLPTAEAIGSLARAKSAIVVGDPNQLPPTGFFTSAYAEEDPETADLESILDDLLAIGMREKRLLWHYRSRHESLISFSNVTYYQGRLNTFPSPDALESRVKFRFVEDGVYDRGFTKRNKREAEELVEDVISRLKDPILSKKSIGIVTFSSVQKEYIERILAARIVKEHVESEAYDGDEPIFVKNLENVQGDERDVILFSVCYGPDRNGRVSLQFGPLNQMGGWRRLNVAITRAREEMVVFSSMMPGMIDLEKTNAKGVVGLRGFMEFALRGKLTLPATERKAEDELGKFIAKDLSAYGYECRYGVGASAFRVDVAVVDPKNPKQFILGILCDREGSVFDRGILQVQTMKSGDWNVTRVHAVSYYLDRKKEIRRIRDLLERLTGVGNRRINVLRCRSSYRFAEFNLAPQADEYLLSNENDKEMLYILRKIIRAEEPISEQNLISRLCNAYGFHESVCAEKIGRLLIRSDFKREKLLGDSYYYISDKATQLGKYRVAETGDRILTPYDVWSLAHCILENRIVLTTEELYRMICDEFRTPYEQAFISRLDACMQEGERRNLFLRSVADRWMLA